MHRKSFLIDVAIRFLLLGHLLVAIPAPILAQGNHFQGIYAGKLIVALSSRGFQSDEYPSRMTVLPNGHSIILTTQLPGTVSNQVIKGDFTGNVFKGTSRGRLNFVLYNWANYWEIRFMQNQARIEKDIVLNPPRGYVQVDKVVVFYRVRS